jgi:hypothetical protein
VVAGGKVAVAVLLDPEDAAVPPVASLGLPQFDGPMDEREDLLVVPMLVALGEEEGRGALAEEEVPQRQDLAAEADVVAGQEPDLAQVVEDDPGRTQVLHRLGDLPRHRGQLDVRGVEDGVQALGGEPLVAEAGVDVQDLDAGEVPAASRGAGS